MIIFKEFMILLMLFSMIAFMIIVKIETKNKERKIGALLIFQCILTLILAVTDGMH